MKTNLLLLAGQGKRFSDAGYALPKPLIEVDGLPMFVRAAKSLPEADKTIFIVRQEQVDEYAIDQKIGNYFPEAEVIIQRDELKGQAHTAYLAKDSVDPESQLTIASCDAGPTYDMEKFNREILDSDVLIWSFRGYPPMRTQPTSYGWIETEADGTVKAVRYKQPISDNPINDHAVVGWFTYAKARTCFDSVAEMMEKNLKSGTEFSLDEATNIMAAKGLAVRVFEIDTFLSWGTPNELRTYLYWQNYFKIKR